LWLQNDALKHNGRKRGLDVGGKSFPGDPADSRAHGLNRGHHREGQRHRPKHVEAELRARLGVGGHVTRIVVSDAGDKARPRLAIGGVNVRSGGALTVVVTLIGWLVALRGGVWLFTQYCEALQILRRYGNYRRARPLSVHRGLCGMSGKRESPASGERETPTAKTS
jgi:hypothetical protein